VVVVVVVATGEDVAVAGAAPDVDAVVLVELELCFAVAPLRRGVVGVEQPSVESATPTNAVSMQTANHFLMCDRSELSTAQQRARVAWTETSWRVGRPRHRRHWHSAPACT
jgi:hypothetical protein